MSNYFKHKVQDPMIEELSDNLTELTDAELSKGKFVRVTSGMCDMLKNECFILDVKQADQLIELGYARPYNDLEVAVAQMRDFKLSNVKLDKETKSKVKAAAKADVKARATRSKEG